MTQYSTVKKEKGKKEHLYSAMYTAHRLKVLRHGSHSFTCKLHRACLSLVSVHQMAPPLTEAADIQLQLTTHLSSATGRAQDSESSPAKDRRSTAVLRNQP